MKTNKAIKLVLSNGYKLPLKHQKSFISSSNKAIVERLEYLRAEIRNEAISYGEIIELVGLKKYINEQDVELLMWIE